MPLALVTGPTAGIGQAFARRLAADGYDLVLVARDKPRLDELAAQLADEHGVTASVEQADLTDRGQLARIEKLVADVDLLVNNAGFGLRRPFWENSVEDEQRQLDIHVTAPMRLTHAAVAAMRRRGSGAIVNVASVAAFTPRGPYSAAKAYVVNLSEWLNQFCKPHGVTVMALCPGFVHTEFHQRMEFDKAKIPSWMWLNADDLVDEAMRDLAAGKAVSVPSIKYKAIVTGTRFVPRRLVGLLARAGRERPT